MSNTFKIPERPWGEAEVKFLSQNADLLDTKTRAELGLDQPEREPDVVKTIGVPGYEATKPEIVNEEPVTPVVEEKKEEVVNNADDNA